MNFGGGHHISRSDYDVDRLCHIINSFQERYGLEVYLEPGEAIALQAGMLVATVLDIIARDEPIAVLDTSFCRSLRALLLLRNPNKKISIKTTTRILFKKLF